MSTIQEAIDCTKARKLQVNLVESGKINVLVLNNLDNRFNVEFCENILSQLDKLEEEKDLQGQVLVTVSTHPKIFSNGVDFENLNTKEEVDRVLRLMFDILRRIIILPIPSIACIHGHAFAGGLFFALAHSFRVMNFDRGWACLNELSNGIIIPEPLLKIGEEKLGLENFWEVCATGSRYTATQALKLKIASSAYEKEEILHKTYELAKRISKKNIEPVAFQTFNKDMFKGTIKACTEVSIYDLTLERIAKL
ncbi:unnamed protein product [Moneuplotes crassus]|uniref:Uncharacterized protein n=1 Tax=Euplotes crassus TaxID=5936 RepID=A0AAD1XG06_EUPCR|nr:unnamed protein product [Moneuplotes crassus]